MLGMVKKIQHNYQAHLPIVQERIEKAGIRLAAVLNNAFK
jgi:hypothetical protein